MKLTSIKVSLKLPIIGDLSGSWEPDESQRAAAWEMYVELVTRVAVVELGPDEGLLREALTSLYSLFAITRGILRQHGPALAQPKGTGRISFGLIAVTVLNAVIRPALAHWHPLLMDYESRKPTAVSAAEWERKWEKNPELRQALAEIRTTLSDYALLLAEVASNSASTCPAPRSRPARQTLPRSNSFR